MEDNSELERLREEKRKLESDQDEKEKIVEDLKRKNKELEEELRILKSTNNRQEKKIVSQNLLQIDPFFVSEFECQRAGKGEIRKG